MGGSRSSPCSPKLASDAARRHNIGLGVQGFHSKWGSSQGLEPPKLIRLVDQFIMFYLTNSTYFKIIQITILRRIQNVSVHHHKPFNHCSTFKLSSPQISVEQMYIAWMFLIIYLGLWKTTPPWLSLGSPPILHSICDTGRCSISCVHQRFNLVRGANPIRQHGHQCDHGWCCDEPPES